MWILLTKTPSLLHEPALYFGIGKMTFQGIRPGETSVAVRAVANEHLEMDTAYVFADLHLQQTVPTNRPRGGIDAPLAVRAFFLSYGQVYTVDMVLDILRRRVREIFPTVGWWVTITADDTIAIACGRRWHGDLNQW